MSHKKDNEVLRTERQLDRMDWETAKELGQEGDLKAVGDGNSQQPEKTGGDGLRERFNSGERVLAREGQRKANLNLKDARENQA